MVSESKVDMPGKHKENKIPRTPNLNVVSARTTALCDVEIFLLTPMEPKHRTTLKFGVRGDP